MEYPQQEHAKRLFHAFKSLAKAKIQGVEIGVGGANVNWHCDVALDARSCRVYCFDYAQEGAEYYWEFLESEKAFAIARTTSQSDAIAAVLDWIRGDSMETLYAKYLFINGKRRTLEAVQAALFANAPELKNAGTVISSRLSDSFCLRLTLDERECIISFQHGSDAPDFDFSWDQYVMFKEKTNDHAMAASILKQWLCERAAPSAMRGMFPFLKISKVADYYEAGSPVEGEFIESWDSIENFFGDRRFPWHDQRIIDFIRSIRRAGFDRMLRAGQSFYILVFSRARRHGLRAGQPNIGFHFGKIGMTVSININGREQRTFPHVAFTDEVKELLSRLAEQPIS